MAKKENAVGGKGAVVLDKELRIEMYFHCRKCIAEIPPLTAPREWAQLEAGWTPLGLQVWCKRHDCNIVHIDFQGQRHPAVM